GLDVSVNAEPTKKLLGKIQERRARGRAKNKKLQQMARENEVRRRAAIEQQKIEAIAQARETTERREIGTPGLPGYSQPTAEANRRRRLEEQRKAGGRFASGKGESRVGTGLLFIPKGEQEKYNRRIKIQIGIKQ